MENFVLNTQTPTLGVGSSKHIQVSISKLKCVHTVTLCTHFSIIVSTAQARPDLINDEYY